MEHYTSLEGSLIWTQEVWDLVVEISFMAERLPSHNRTGSPLCVLYQSPVLSTPTLKESLAGIKISLHLQREKKKIPIRIQSCVLVWWGFLPFIYFLTKHSQIVSLACATKSV